MLELGLMELLTTDELSEILRLSRSRIVLMAKRGEIPAVMLSGRLRFDASEIEKWVNGNRIRKPS